MKNNLDQYRKKETKAEPKETTSVYLETKQIEFVSKNSLNLSLLVRKLLAKLMRGEKIDL